MSLQMGQGMLKTQFITIKNKTWNIYSYNTATLINFFSFSLLTNTLLDQNSLYI